MRHASEEHSRTEFNGLTNDEWVLKFSVGFSQKQFWYQKLGKIVDEFNRQVELLEIIPSEIASRMWVRLAILQYLR